MSVGIPAYSTGIINSGADYNYQLINVIRAGLKAYLSGGTPAWVDYDIVIPTLGSADYVLKSVGDPSLGIAGTLGDTSIYVRLVQDIGNSRFKINIFQDWSTDSHTGLRETSALYNPVVSGDIEWFLSVNEYGFVLVYVQGGIWQICQAGCLIRPFSAAINGVGRVLTATSGTGTVVVALDRDISANIQIGQKVWLVNQTPLAAALATDYTELVSVSGVSSSTITVTGVTNTPYKIGSLVGIDPMPVFVHTGANLSLPSGSIAYFTNDRDGSGSGGTYGYFGLLMSFDETLEDPSFDGLYVANPIVINMAATSLTGFRGFIGTRLFACSNGTFVDKDTMKIDFDAAQVYKIFPSLSNPVGSWCPAIGPGAS